MKRLAESLAERCSVASSSCSGVGFRALGTETRKQSRRPSPLSILKINRAAFGIWVDPRR